MSYSGSDSIGLIMPNGNSYDYPPEQYSPPFWTTEIGFPIRHQSDGDPIGDSSEGEQSYHSCFGYSTSYTEFCRDLFFNFQDQDPYGYQNGCTMENTDDILLHNEDYNGDSRNLGYESAWDCFQSWFRLGEDEFSYHWNGRAET